MDFRSFVSFVRLGALVLILAPGFALSQVDPECDLDGDGVVDDLPSDYDELTQYVNLLNFYGATMTYSPLKAPAPFAPYKLTPQLELSYLPQLNCVERAVFNGTKSEHTNKSYVLPRIRIAMGLPMGFYVGLGGDPPVPLFGVRSLILSAEAGWAHVFSSGLQAGARAHVVAATVSGDIAGPVEGDDPVDDIYKNRVWGIEGMVGYTNTRPGLELKPYLGIGFTSIRAGMYIGEDEVLVGKNLNFTRADGEPFDSDGAGVEDLHDGVNLELGLQAAIHDIQVGAEVYMLPISGFRFFFSPRLSVGYAFF